MSYVNPEWVTNIYIRRAISATDFSTNTLPVIQSAVDTELELLCRMAKVAVDEIPTDEGTGFVTSSILIKWGRQYLTYACADALREADEQNRENDVYDGVANKYEELAQDTADQFTRPLIIDEDPNEPIKVIDTIRTVPIFGG